MVAKKNKKKVVEASNGLVKGPVTVDGCVHLSESDLLRYELLQARVIQGYQVLQIKKSEIDRLKREAEERIRVLNVEILNTTSETKSQEEELRSFQAELAKKYGLDPKEISYDDKTGKIFLKGEPVSSGT